MTCGRLLASASTLTALAAVAILAVPTGVGAAPPGIVYGDFSSTAGLTLNGDAAQAGTALRLVPDAAARHGSAWAQTTVDTSRSFESSFRVLVHDGTVYPADGMTFTLQAQGPAALGEPGSEHGYGGATAVSPSVAVDVSLFPQIFDGSTEQVSVLANGDTGKPLATASSPVLLFGNPFGVWVDYDAKTHVLEAFVGQGSTKPAAPLVTATVDLAATVGSSVYAGFTAGTGTLHAAFDVLGWQLDGTSDTTAPTVACAASPSVLWPPTNKLVPITSTVTVTDSDSGAAGFTLLSVTSNEGDIGSESKGWSLGTPDTGGSLLAARLGSGVGRVYTLTYEGRDAAGNAATCAATVTVPHDHS